MSRLAAIVCPMNPALTSLVALQQLDTAAETARRRLGELPGVEQELAARLDQAGEAVEVAKVRLADNQTARREIEKQVAAVDTRLARFDEHKASVKTNQEYTALLSEIATARAEKDRFEEQILELMEQGDALAADIADAEAARAAVAREGDETRAALVVERQSLEAEVDRLMDQRSGQTKDLAPNVLARYEQLLKQRRKVAVAAVNGETCAACHVRLRPALTQAIRRGTEIIQCDSCQRILYAEPKPDAADTPVA